MGKTEKTKKINKKDIEKQRERSKTHWIPNFLCAIAGVGVLLLGILVPKTIFAMMDKNEVNKIYIQEADVSYMDETSKMSMEEKLNLLDWRNMGLHVSASYPSDNAYALKGNEKLHTQVMTQVKQMQDMHLLPQFDFEIEYMEADTIIFNYESLLNLENMNQYLMLAYMTYQVSGDYVYIEVDVETGKILGYTVYAEITQEEWQELLKADIAQYMADNLGVSKSVIAGKYQYDVYNEKGTICKMDANGNLVQDYYDAYEPDLDSDMESVQIGMWMNEGDEAQDADSAAMDKSSVIY